MVRWLGARLHQAVRVLVRRPDFTIPVVAALALSIGASTAVFMALDRVLFREPDYGRVSELVSFGFLAPIEAREFLLGADYTEWKQAQTPFEAMTSLSGVVDCDLTEGEPARITCAQVESNLLDMLQVKPAIGSTFSGEQDRPGGEKAVLLSDGLWRTRYGADRNLIGRSIRIDGMGYRVMGVLPRGFELPTLQRFDAMIPQQLDPAEQKRPNTGRVLRTFARLKPGVEANQAGAGLQSLFQRSLEFVPAPFRKEVRLQVRSLVERQTAESRPLAWLLFGSVGAVFAIACLNVSQLLLALGLQRQREHAVRLALGAGRGALVAQALLEGLLLAGTSVLLGIAVAWALLRGMIALAPEGLLRLPQGEMDLRAALFAALSGTAVALLAAAVPAWQPANPEVLTGSRTSGLGPGRVREILLAMQVGFAVLLLSGAGLLLRSFWKAQQTETALRLETLTTASFTLSASRYPAEPQQRMFFEKLEAALLGVPGMSQAAISDTAPPSGRTRSRLYAVIDVEGRPRSEQGTGGMVVWRAVTPSYFDLLGIRVLRGRALREEDRASGAEPAIVLSQSLAARMFPGEEPLGRKLRPGRSGPWRTVVGVVADVRNAGLNEKQDPEYYVPRRHEGGFDLRNAVVLVRSSGATGAAAAAKRIREMLGALDAELPVQIQSMAARVDAMSQRQEFQAVLLASFAGIGVLLAAIGVYGITSLLVSQRTREIGVRMALGATAPEIVRWTLRRTGVWVALGMMLGVAAALAGARLMASLLYQVSPQDPPAMLSALLALLSVAGVAAWWPARRAASIDPAEALRRE